MSSTKTTTTEKTKPMTPTELIDMLAKHAEITKLQAKNFLGSLSEVVLVVLSGDEPPPLTIPGICKFKSTVKPARPESQGTNPFNGNPMTIKAKPASVKITTTPSAVLVKEIMAAKRTAAPATTPPVAS